MRSTPVQILLCTHSLSPASQLTRYDLDCPWETHSQLLRSLPLLEEVRIRCFRDDDEDWPEPGEPIELTILRRFFVTDPTALDYVRAPSLHEIGIIALSPECMEPIQPFLGSACSPHCLRIQVAVTPLGLEKHFRHEMFPAFISLFTISETTSPAQALPHVSHIIFGFQDAAIADGHQFLPTAPSCSRAKIFRQVSEVRKAHDAAFIFESFPPGDLRFLGCCCVYHNSHSPSAQLSTYAITKVDLLFVLVFTHLYSLSPPSI
ncbi:hypothetical protein C8R45DRAFT_1217459 [Mycena sanguinolenta]|nr:hypothetical protein C8R45DRAFT_1217459 [Mycena sanguinolenta]